MLVKTRRFFLSASLCLLLGCSQSDPPQRAYDYRDHQAWSQSPPCGLDVDQVPQFVVFGFDDNFSSGLEPGESGGLRWILELFANRNVKATFYNVGKHITPPRNDRKNRIQKAWARAAAEGHELANHTQNHADGEKFSLEEWLKTIDTCDHQLNSLLSKPTTGFRAPYLHYNDNTFSALVKINFTYDSSIEEGWQLDPSGTEFNWPYTLDQGSPGAESFNQAISPHPGLWELGVTPFVVPPELTDSLGRRVRGLDHDLLVNLAVSKEHALAVLMHTLDQRLQGNRAPLVLCLHPNLYSDSKRHITTASTPLERRQILEQFLDYCLSKTEVRVVTAEELIDWMRDPVALKSQQS